ncbi:MAG: NAD(+) synthase [Bdellovibrionales bacterium]|nr:NAD(+) synthase [Bdellovibrionales bacterium]
MTNWTSFGFSRFCALFPKVELGNPLANAQTFITACKAATAGGASVVATPELALTGYTCEDLFHSEALIRDVEGALIKIRDASKDQAAVWVIGAPLRLVDGRLLNGAWVIYQGKVLGVVPKVFLPNMGEFYERRWFVTGRRVHEKITHPKLGEFWVSVSQVFSMGAIRLGVEVCQDLWGPEQTSTRLALKGANLIVNLSASTELVGKPAVRRRLVQVQSSRLLCAYAYVGAGTYESSKDTVFSGHSLFAELGDIFAENEPFDQSRDHLMVDFDFERILNARTKDICFLETVDEASAHGYQPIIHALPLPVHKLDELKRPVEPYPFIGEIPDFEDVLAIQSQGLWRRVQSANSKSLIIGISGGLDSTLALCVAMRTKALSGGKLKVVGVMMPGPGTSEKTLNISRVLLESAQVDQTIEVPIDPAVQQHLKDLGKTDQDRSVVFENAQARERTQILFDLANEHGGLVVGTGDLSELALGWCTFNADHMAHYAVNSGIPKTVVKGLVGYWGEIAQHRGLKTVIEKILDLPISPELLPPGEGGEISQETEAIIGSYDLHDFYLYHFLNHGYSREKIHALAEVAFKDDRELLGQIDRSIEIFFKRFFSQQFKRTTLPPGPKVHQVGLSPRSDFRLPDEIK